MKINYKDADGRVIELEVTEEVGSFYLTSLEDEKSNDRRNTRRHTQLSTFQYEDARFFDSGIDISRSFVESDTVKRVMDKLTDRERSLILSHYRDGRTYTEIAKSEGKYPSTIMRETDKAADKFKRIYREMNE